MKHLLLHTHPQNSIERDILLEMVVIRTLFSIESILNRKYEFVGCSSNFCESAWIVEESEELQLTFVLYMNEYNEFSLLHIHNYHTDERETIQEDCLSIQDLIKYL